MLQIKNNTATNKRSVVAFPNLNELAKMQSQYTPAQRAIENLVKLKYSWNIQGLVYNPYIGKLHCHAYCTC